MRQLKNKDIKEQRERLSEEQGHICPLCECIIEPGDSALDHDHETGMIRGVLHKWCNSAEGALKAKFKRSGVAKYTDFETYLKNLHFYLIKDHHLMLHPTHAPRDPKLMKSSYNALIREIKNCNKYREKPEKYPAFPKSGKLTRKLKELFQKYGLEPRYYGRK